MVNGTVLIAGASGILGQAAVEQFLDEGWDVVALSRRAPDALGHPRLRHVAVDLRDAGATRAAVAEMGAVTHLVYAALYEKPGLVAGWSEADQMATNLAMFQHLVDPLTEGDGPLHVTLFQGTKAYGSHLHDIRIPSKEREPRDGHDNFYWLQEDDLRARAAARPDLTFTILRPQMVVGGAIGVAMNVLPAVGVYAALRAHRGEPCGFPGGPPFVWEAADARLVARACSWAGTHAVAAGETYNITNGDVFAWRDLWPAMMEALGVEAGPDEPVALAEFVPAHADEWRAIARAHDLPPLELDALLGESLHMADYCFAYGQTGQPRAKFISTVKVRQHGFADCLDTEECYRYWLGRMVERGLFPDWTASRAGAA